MLTELIILKLFLYAFFITVGVIIFMDFFMNAYYHAMNASKNDPSHPSSYENNHTRDQS